MNEITATEADVVIPELWSLDVLEALYQAGVALNRVTRVDGEVRGKGDILHLPAMPSFSVNNVGATGSVTNQALTLTEVQLTVDKWKETTVDILDKTEIQSVVDLAAAYKGDMGAALSEQIDDDIIDLFSDVTSNVVGDGTSNANEDLATAAIAELMNDKLGPALRDPNRVSFMFHTNQWAPLKKVDAFNNANLTGESMGGALKMAIPNLYGIPVFFSTLVDASGSSYRENVLFVREAFAVGIQRNIQLEKLARTKLSDQYVAHVLYGVKTRAQARACMIKTAVTA